MSDIMLHGVLNMPLPDDPAQMDLVTWLQFRDRARQASQRIQDDAAVIAAADALAAWVQMQGTQAMMEGCGAFSRACDQALAAYNAAKDQALAGMTATGERTDG